MDTASLKTMSKPSCYTPRRASKLTCQAEASPTAGLCSASDTQQHQRQASLYGRELSSDLSMVSPLSQWPRILIFLRLEACIVRHYIVCLDSLLCVSLCSLATLQLHVFKNFLVQRVVQSGKAVRRLVFSFLHRQPSFHKLAAACVQTF